MQQSGECRVRPELKELVLEASRGLAQLDAERLEELALSCRALNCGLTGADVAERAKLAREAREAAGDLAVFARVLEATRANLHVLKRLREMRVGRPEYGPELAREWALTEGSHGND